MQINLWAYCPFGTIESVGAEPNWANLPEHAKDVWLPVIENQPEIQPWETVMRNHYTQWIVDLPNKTVYITYTVTNKTSTELIGALYRNVKQFIEQRPDGLIRYDSDLKMNIIASALNAAEQGQPKPDLCILFESWINAVQIEFFRLLELLRNGQVENDISVQHFENLFGVYGTYLADPEISTAQLKEL